MSTPVKTRIAPSPTGNLHIGTVRTALHSYLYAKKNGGAFVIRIEDTDKERSTKAFEENILAGLAWLGIKHDEMYRQSEHKARHTELLQTLIDSGSAYLSKEPSKNDPSKEVEVVRLKNPNKKITFTDVIRGDITFDTTELGDMVIARAIDDPLYHFAVVVDDHDEAITHVIRGEDHISNTPRQILIHEALGFEHPQYAHLPLILGPDRSKMSKRHGAVSVDEYREQGYLKEALINFIAFLGWNPGTEQELFSMSELIDTFDLEHIQKGGAVFNIEKLNWFNREWMKRMSPEERTEQLIAALQDFPELQELFTASSAARDDLLERIATFGEAKKLAEEREFDYYTKRLPYDKENLFWKKDPDPIKTREHLASVRQIVENIAVTDWDAVRIKDALWPYADEHGKGNVLWPLRFALSGRERSPDPFTLMEALGKDETLARADIAISSLS